MLKLKILAEIVENIKSLPKAIMDDRSTQLKRKRDIGGWRFSERDRMELMCLEVSINELNSILDLLARARQQAEEALPFPINKGPNPHFN